MVIKWNLFRTTATSAQILDAYTSLLSGSRVVYYVTEDNFVNIDKQLIYLCEYTVVPYDSRRIGSRTFYRYHKAFGCLSSFYN